MAGLQKMSNFLRYCQAVFQGVSTSVNSQQHMCVHVYAPVHMCPCGCAYLYVHACGYTHMYAYAQ